MVQLQEATPTFHGQESLDKVFVNQSKALQKAGMLEFDYYNVCKFISLPKCIKINHCPNSHKNAKLALRIKYFLTTAIYAFVQGKKDKKINKYKKNKYKKSQKCLVDNL